MVNESESARDIEFQEFERHDLLTGEPRYQEDEIRDSSLSLILGGAAALFSLIAMILTWVLYFRERRRTFLWHAIWLIFALLFAALCAVWGLQTSTGIKSGKQPNAMLTMVVFLGALFYFVYLLAQVMWLIFYYAVHHAYLVGLSTNQENWDKRMVRGSQFSDGWRQSSRLMTWTILFSLITAGCFAFIAYAARSVVWNRYQLTRFGLYWALFWISLGSWILIYWCEEAFEYDSFIDSPSAKNEVKVLKVLAILALIYAFLNAIVNLLKIKIGYFFFAILGLVLMVLFVCTTGLLWREIRGKQNKEQQSSDKKSNCMITMMTIHENNFKGLCPLDAGKYGSTCTKDLLTPRWEADNAPTFLNPACCTAAKFFYLKPYLYCAYWATIIMIALAIATGCNFYLGDTSEYLTNANKAITPGDILGLAGIVIAGIAFILYFIFRKANSIPNGSRGNIINSFRGPTEVGPNVEYPAIEGWDIVPPAVITAANPPPAYSVSNTGKVCFKYDPKSASNPNPVFKTSGADTDCTDPNTCVIRVAIATFDGTTLQTPSDVSINVANSDSRYFYFPNCPTIKSFVNVWGTESQVQAFLAKLEVCPDSTALLPTLQFYKDQVKGQSLYSSGLRDGEATSGAASNTNAAMCSNGFNDENCSADMTCRWSAKLQSQVVFRSIKGRLYYIENGNRVYTIRPDVTIVAKDAAGLVSSDYTLLQDGTFTLRKIPKYKDNIYRITLEIKDAKGLFLDKRVDVPIDVLTTDDISAGEIRLNTKNGKICKVEDTKCIDEQKVFANGRINVVIQDGSSAAVSASTNSLSGATVELKADHVYDGANFAKGGLINSDASGAGAFVDIPYGAYTVVASKTGYRPSVQLIDLQEPTSSPKAFVLNPTAASDYDLKIIAEMVSVNTDYDLHVEMESDSGKTCTVSPYNKYCPYAAHLSDLQGGPGEEQVIIKKLAVSNYLSYVTASPDYDSNCQGGAKIHQNFNLIHAQGIHWADTPQSSKKILIGEIVTRVLSNFFQSKGDNLPEQVLIAFPRRGPVEDEATAKTLRQAIFTNGAAVPPGIEKKLSTWFIDEDRKTDEDKTKVKTPVSDKYLSESEKILPDTTLGVISKWNAEDNLDKTDGNLKYTSSRKFTQTFPERIVDNDAFATVTIYGEKETEKIRYSSLVYTRDGTLIPIGTYKYKQTNTTDDTKTTLTASNVIDEETVIPPQTGKRQNKTTTKVDHKVNIDKSKPSTTASPKSENKFLNTTIIVSSEADESDKNTTTITNDVQTIFYQDALLTAPNAAISNLTLDSLKVDTDVVYKIGKYESRYLKIKSDEKNLVNGNKTINSETNKTTYPANEIIFEATDNKCDSCSFEEPLTKLLFLHLINKNINDSTLYDIKTKVGSVSLNSNTFDYKLYKGEVFYFVNTTNIQKGSFKNVTDKQSSGRVEKVYKIETNNTVLEKKNEKITYEINCDANGRCVKNQTSTSETTGIKMKSLKATLGENDTFIVPANTPIEEIRTIDKIETSDVGAVTQTKSERKITFNEDKSKLTQLNETEELSGKHIDGEKQQKKITMKLTPEMPSKNGKTWREYSSVDVNSNFIEAKTTAQSLNIVDNNIQYDAAGAEEKFTKFKKDLNGKKYESVIPKDLYNFFRLDEQNSAKGFKVGDYNYTTWTYTDEAQVQEWNKDMAMKTGATAETNYFISYREMSSAGVYLPPAKDADSCTEFKKTIKGREFRAYDKSVAIVNQTVTQCKSSTDGKWKRTTIESLSGNDKAGAARADAYTLTLIEIYDTANANLETTQKNEISPAGRTRATIAAPPAKATGRRRLLMEKKSAHPLKKPVRKPVHKADASAVNYQFINCFTGFGYSSTVIVDKIQDAKPTMADCKSLIDKQNPELTVAKLRAKVTEAKTAAANAPK